MKYTAIVLVALVLAVSTVQASDVLTLTTADFEKINQYELALVKFYAPWCGHCKVLAPAWEEIATKFADNDKVAIVKVDCTENQATCGKYGVRGYPTIKLFVGGTTGAISDYNGDRNAGAIIGFIEKKSSPPVKTLESASDVSEFKSDDDDDSNVIAHVSSAEDLEKIRSAALRIDDLDWAVVSDAALQEGEENVIFIYADHLSKPLRYEEFPLDLETFKKFVLANAYAPVQAIGQESWERATSRKLPLVIGIDKFENEQLPADFKTILNEAAAKYKDRFSFLYGDSAKLEQAVSGMGGTGKVFPTLIVLSSDEESRATLPGPHTFVWNEKETVTSSGVDAWLKAALDGTVQPFKKSQPIPENDGPVKTLVALNFDDAIKATEWVFIKFYAPWCGHCKTLAPIWEELGEEFKSDDRVTIAKMDVTENYLDTKYGVSSFPTLILLHNGEIHGEKYSEGRTLEDLSKFLRKTIAGDNTHSAEGHGHSHDHDEL